MRLAPRLSLTCAMLGALLLSLPAPAPAAGTAQASAGGEQTDVIVILRDQVAGVPASLGHHAERRAALHAAQAPVLTTLNRLQAARVHGFDTINAIATRIPKSAVAELAAHPAVQAVLPDLLLRQAPRQTLRSRLADAAGATPAGSGSSGGGSSGTSSASSQLCNTLEPEALQLTHAAYADSQTPQAQLLLDGNGKPVTGSGVKVAFIADGLDTKVPGFVRPDGSSVFFDYQDFTGDPAGTITAGGEAFGDASSIAAQDSYRSYPLLFDISQFAAPGKTPASPCTIRIRGMAPGASLVGLKVYSEYTTTISNFVQAIEYAVTVDHVDVINESFGSNPYADNSNDPTSLANAAAIAAGVTVVASTGDAGTAGTLGSPATDPGVIAVGASTQFRLYAQIGYGAQALAKGYGSNNISALSSGGFAQTGARTVDLVAPGDLGWALCSSNTSLYSDCTNINGAPSSLLDFGGTSESAPLTSGAAALVIQAYRSTHGGASPTPAQVKQILMSTATDLGALPSEQGAGLINAYAAVQLALSTQDTHGRPAASGQTVAVSPNMVEVSGTPGSLQFAVLNLTNSGTTRRTLNPSLQVLGSPIASAKLTVQLAPATDPSFSNVAGAARDYVEQSFVVPSGADHLDAAIAWPTPPSGTGSGTIVYLALLDPSGNQVAYSLPQGVGNGYGHVDVVHPAAGTWTAVVYGRPSGDASYSGPVQFSWAAQRYVNAGWVFPSSVSLAPGASTQVFALYTLPSQPGDSGMAFRFACSDGLAAPGEVPLLARTLVPIGRNGASFSGTLTGGNGRAGAGPTQTFAFDVPPGLKNLGVAVNANDTGYLLEGVLVDPSGMQVSVAPNQDPTTGATTTALQSWHANPMPGRWRFMLLQNFYSSGNQTSYTFNANISLNQSGVSTAALPASASVKLHAGQPVTIPVSVTNTSGLVQQYFADARLQAPVTQSLPVYQCGRMPALPGACGYTLLPTQVTRADFTSQSTVPITMDASNSQGTNVGGTGSPDIFASSGSSGIADASLTAAEVPNGFWYLIPSAVGPYPSTGVVPVGVNFGATVRMLPFDAATAANSGDIWADLVLGTNTFNPLVLQPGQSGTIKLTITPSGTPGTTVNGYLFVDTYNGVVSTGDELVRQPYSYTIVP